MARFAAFLLLFGFGSAAMHVTHYQFRLLIWAEPMQPWLGLVMGAVGLLLIAFSRTKDDQPAPVQRPMPRGGHPAPQSYGPPSGPQQRQPMPQPAPYGGPPMHQGMPQGHAQPRPPQYGTPQYGPPQYAPQGYPQQPQYGPPQGYPRQQPYPPQSYGPRR